MFIIASHRRTRETGNYWGLGFVSTPFIFLSRFLETLRCIIWVRVKRLFLYVLFVLLCVLIFNSHRCFFCLRICRHGVSWEFCCHGALFFLRIFPPYLMFCLYMALGFKINWQVASFWLWLRPRPIRLSPLAPLVQFDHNGWPKRNLTIFFFPELYDNKRVHRIHILLFFFFLCLTS